MKFNPKDISKILHVPTTITLILIGVFLSVLLFVILYSIFANCFLKDCDIHYTLEKIFLILLIIEIITSIKIYFSENFHFPLRFFFYIGITDLIRHIIINRDNAEYVLLNTAGILLLVIALSLHELKNNYLHREKNQSGQIHFEL